MCYTCKYMELVGAHGERLVLSTARAKTSENNQVHPLYSLSLLPEITFFQKRDLPISLCWCCSIIINVDVIVCDVEKLVDI